MQILQEKGKHANGPYGLRVWGRVRRKEEVTWVLGGPAPDVFSCDASQREGPATSTTRPTSQPGVQPTRMWELTLDNRMVSRRPETPVIFAWKKIIWEDPKKPKEYDLPPKWREVRNTNRNPHSQCQEKMVRDREGTGAWERDSCGPPWSLSPLTSRCQMLPSARTVGIN